MIRMRTPGTHVEMRIGDVAAKPLDVARIELPQLPLADRGGRWLVKKEWCSAYVFTNTMYCR